MISPRLLYTSVSLICLTMGINEVWAANAPNIHSSHQSISKAIKPEPSSFQIARAVFLPDTKDDLGYSGRYIDNEYFKETFCDDYPLFSCPAHGQCSECRININKKKLDSCFSPYIKSENHCICPPSVSLNYANEKCLRYCDGDCIEKSCTKTPNQTGCTNGTQACNDGCGGNTRQCCIACTDIITTKPSNSYYIYSSCNDGSQTRQIKTGWACDQGYSQSGNSCEKNCVPKDCSSYPLYSPPSSGLYETCTVGCGSGIVRYKSTCTPKDCSAYPFYTAPSNASYETCSVGCNSGITKYRLTTCNAGYYLDGESCIKCTKSYSSCLDGKTLVNTCKNASGTTVGDCVDCRDETSPYNPCYGYYICEGEKIGNGATCLCGNITYYDQCLVKDNCTYEYRKDPTCASGIRNRNGSCEYTGTYLKGDTCVSNVDGYTYYRDRKFCNLYSGPCYRFKESSDCSGYGGLDTSSESCSCGGKTFYKSCKNSCLFEYREDPTCAGGIRKRDGSCESTGKSLDGRTCVHTDGYTYYEYAFACTLTGTPCGGFKNASNCSAYGGLDTSSKSCTCGGKTFYKSCKTSCTYQYRADSSCAGGIRKRDGSCESTGKSLDGRTCVHTDGYTYYEYAFACILTGTPCDGFKNASNCSAYGGLDTSSESCSCGGATFYKSCKNLYECNYEETFASCKAKGKGFVFKCADEAGNRYGECS